MPLRRAAAAYGTVEGARARPGPGSARSSRAGELAGRARGRSSARGRPASISSRTLATICRSAALGRSPPSVPSAIQPSTLSRWPGSAARSARDRVRRRPRSACARAARHGPPASARDRPRRRRDAAWRPRGSDCLGARVAASARARSGAATSGWSTSSPHASASRPPRAAAGYSGGSGWRASSSRRIAREPTHLVAVVEHDAGHGAAPKRSLLGRAWKAGTRSTRSVRDALELERLASRSRTGARPGRRRAWRSCAVVCSAPCCSSSTSATPRRTSAPTTATGWSSTGASRPCATSTSDELGAALRNLLALRALGFDDIDASIVSSTVPALRPEWTAMAARYLGHEMPVVGPGVKTGMPIRIDNPRELGADRLVNAVAAYDAVGGPCIVVDLGTALTFDIVSERRRVRRRHHRARRRDLDGGADLSAPRRCRRSTSTPPRTLIGKGTVDAIRSGVIYGFAAQVDGIVDAPARGARRGDRGDRHRRPGHRRSSRSASRSTRSTTCSRSRACGSSGSATR